MPYDMPVSRLNALPEALERILARRATRTVEGVGIEEYLKGAVIEDTQGGGGFLPFEPWDHLVETLLAWEAGGNEVVLKARQIGLSQALALYAGKVARRPGALVLLISQGEDEAKELLRKVKVSLTEHRTYPAQLTRDGANVLEVAGGGRVLALPSTAKAGRSYTAALVATDEAAFHPFPAQNFKAYKPALDGGGQHLVVSTSVGETGWYAEQWQGAESKATGYRARFYPWWVRPGRDEEWYATEKADWRGMDVAFKREYPATPQDAFVGLEGLVHTLVPARHIKAPQTTWRECKWRVAGVDFGGGDPTAVIPLGVSRMENAFSLGSHVPLPWHVHQYGEFYKTGPTTIEDIAGYLWKLHDLAPFNAILCDPSEPVAIASLRATGLPAFAAGEGEGGNDRGQGLQWVQWLLDNDRLTISPMCQKSIFEFSGYRWKEHTDPNSRDRYATSTPVGHHGDGMDARRYGVLHIMRSLMKDIRHQEMVVEVVV